MVHELLSPVGNMESLYQAIHNGADAVYLGLKLFGARSFAKNFSNEEMKDAIRISHLYGVKVYVTMNTLVKNHEVDLFLQQVKFLYEHGVDAIIMQDFGMICLVRKLYPDLEIHASTQANNSSIETIKLYHLLGVKRVVLSRELSLEEIESIDIPIELEVFIHGALCISYSGNCLMSSMIGNRSGNRGECAGSCRLPYTLEKEGKVLSKNKYLLSTKELNTSMRFNDLLKSKIKSFKIEGRMKSPEYVGFITKFYRNLIDQKPIDLENTLDKLKTIYHREFTIGNLFNDKELMNTKTPNHIGLKIGQVIGIDKDKIKIKLERELNQEDGIRFLESGKGFIVNYLYNENKKLISSSNNIVYIDNKVGLTTKDTVYKTLDKKLMEELKRYELKKLNIHILVTAKKNKKLKVIFTLESNKVEVEGSIVEEALTSPISKEKIKTQLIKLGNTPFICEDIELDIDENIFISIKELNELRRKATELLIEKRSESNRKIKEEKIAYKKLTSFNDNYFTCSVQTEEQLKTCLKLNFKRIYIQDNDLYQKYKDNSKVCFMIERNQFNIANTLVERNVVSEYLDPKENIIYGNYPLNVYNIYTMYFLLEKGFLNLPISVELNEEEINSLYQDFINKLGFNPPMEILVYGRVENMIIKGNILNIKENDYYDLIDQRNRCFKVYVKNNKTHILNYKKKEDINKYKFPCIKRFDFYEEKEIEIINIVNKWK